MWNNKQSISAGDKSINLIAGRDIYYSCERNIPTELVNQKIQEEVERLRKSRFFPGFNRKESSLKLGGRLFEGDLSSGSDKIRGEALAWCARILSSDFLEQAQNYLGLAKKLGDSPKTTIAEAFIISQKGEKAVALKALAGIDSHASHSAGLIIVAHHDGYENALLWMDAASYKVGDLDSDGKAILLFHQLQLGRWDEIAQTVDALLEIDFNETPFLHHLAALAKLVRTIPKALRADVLTQVPFGAKEFPLSSDTAAIDARNTAHQHFLDAVEVAKQLDCPNAAKIFDEYALWLELRDPTQSAHGKKRLEDKLRDPHTALGLVHYALQFGIKLNLEAVEQDIERSIAINGGMTIEAALARYALAFTQSTPEEVADYLDRHYSQLANHINTKLMRYRQIEMLARAGLVDRANEILSQLITEGIPTEQESSNLQRIITEAQGSDPIESRKAQYQSTKTISDLIDLVSELEEHHRWNDLCEFSKLLFEETHSLRDAERLVNAFNNTHRSEELVGFLKENHYLLSQSNHLCLSYAWGLYNEGAFLESRAVLAELGDDIESTNYRALQVNLGIATGDWASLFAYIAAEYQKRNDRSAQDLISSAQLALHLGLSCAKDLVFEAAEKARDDPNILASAYFIATSSGGEDNPRVFQWLEKAAKISGENGPLQRVSMKDILDRKPEWDRRTSETWRLLAQGQTPIFLAAQSLNRTLIDLTVFPALVNLTELDPRRRGTIPAYSGKRVPLEFKVCEKTVALDATALLTLSFLKILDVVLDTFKAVYIPHSMLGWLFAERQKTAFHQPSRIANAHKVRDFLATDMLEKFTPSTAASSDLCAQVGDELAALIAEAEKVRDDDTQHIVVRSAPVHRLSSLMEEEADLSAHAQVLSSCLAVVEKLRQKGQITTDEEKRARVYLQLQEKPWSNQPIIADGATLYLDALAITYLQHLGMLGKFKAAGLRAVVSPKEVSETNAFISFERTFNDVKDIIEDIRASVSSRLEAKRIKAGRSLAFSEIKDKSILNHPSAEIFALAPYCNVVIVDDRFLNQHAHIESGGIQVPVFSTLELLDTLVAAGVLSNDDRLEHRTRLRQAGYCFIPVTADELQRCLSKSSVSDGRVIETAELKAIRESILRIRMSDWLQLPEEVPWLDSTLKAFVQALKNLWIDGIDIEEITTRSNWLVDQIDIRGWAHRLIPDKADNVVRTEHAASLLLLLAPPAGVQQSVEDAYHNWVEERILAPIQEQFTEVYEWFIDRYRSFVAQIADTPISDEEKDNL
ncbi:PIN domain-containing protein [Nitrosomonas sp.]|uniref:HTH domain-containing protein n=1 Tax=Nitrosomonas sp. TaxID=42353 RepID=UPI001D1D2D71|nr:hypothetical protein [Nitrosomonas sp.]MBX3615914.1 hypothetical protein [Nitrosomonas sp.]